MRMNRPIRLLLIVVLILSIGVSAARTSEIYISPAGNDTNPGTKLKPFATLTQARDAVRRLKRESPDKDINVLLRGGVYRLTETVVFTSEDSGNAGQNITYAVYPGEKPILTAGIPIEKWKKLTSYPKNLPKVAHGKVWVADVSFIRKTKKEQSPSPTIATQMKREHLFYTLYEGNHRLPRARSKRFSIGTISDTDAFSKFTFPKGALHNWPDISQAEIALIPQRKWMSNILPVKYVDEEKGIAETTVRATYELAGTQGYSNPNVQIENVMAVLDEPGEWVLDSRADKLYLWPVGGKPGDDIVAPVLTELIRVEGKIDYEGPADVPVRNLAFKGLTFTHSDRFPWHGRTGWGVQHDWERFDSPSAMLRFRGAENCVVEDCRFVNADSSGLRFDLYAQNNKVIGNLFEHLGGVGVLLAGYGPGTKDVNKKNEVSNNLIRNIGELYLGSPALFVWQSGENHIAHNLMHDLPYAGICVTGRIVWDPEGIAECSRTIRWHEIGGEKIAKRYRDEVDRYHKSWTWGEREKFLHSRNNIVKRNDIHDVMQVCRDGNCIYISGAGGGNLILENYCHDCPSPHMNNAIRCDDDQCETTIKRNIIFRTAGYAEGFIIKGRNYLIENMVVDLHTTGRHRGYLRFYTGDVTGSVIQCNVFYSCEKGQKVYQEGFSRGGRPAPRLRNTKADYNLYYSTVDPQWGIQHLLEQRQNGIEQHSISADPLFVDVDKEDFRFRPGSPALRLGVGQPVSINEVGLQAPYRERWNRK